MTASKCLKVLLVVLAFIGGNAHAGLPLPGGLSIDPIMVDFGSVRTGTTAEQRVTITNNNSATTVILTAVHDILRAPWALVRTCDGTMLEPGGSCSFTYSFSPTTFGPQVAPTFVIVNGQYVAMNLFGTGISGIAPPNPINTIVPALSSIPSALGIGTQPAVVDLSRGAGPAMTACLVSAVRGLLGPDPVYMGQAPSGAARISERGNIISFYPIVASATLRPLGVNLGDSNLLNLGTSCGSFDVAPALHSVAEFGAAVQALGLVANISAQGVITVNTGSAVYVARPDYYVTPGAPGLPSLQQGPDGLYRFTDSAGFTQLLRPAFEDTTALAAQAPQALATGAGFATTIQVDGTAVLANPGSSNLQIVLTPDLTRPSAARTGMGLWIQDGPNHYLFRGSDVGAAQGFTSNTIR
nr:choice-of-anchor D domain-containing protein [uncultured Rhodoferax sp.]